MDIDPDLAELSRTIDPAVLGTRLRNARLGAGLTQSELAAGAVSGAYISRIESGARRPELHLLSTLSKRCNTSLEELLIGIPRSNLLELELEVDHAEIDHSSGNAAQALERITSVLPRLRDSAEVGLTRRAERLEALSLESLGRLDEAIILLEKVTSRPEPNEEWLRELIALSRCYRESGDFNRAIAVGERAKEVIERLGLNGMTEAVQLTLTVAAAYIQTGELGHAMRLCLRAIEDADRAGSPFAKASAYWNASAIKARQGATASALELAKTALAILELGDDARNLGRLRTEVAHMYLKTEDGSTAAAFELLDRAEVDLAWSSATPLDRADLLIVRAKAHLMAGEVEQSALLARQSRKLTHNVAPLLEAESWAIEGQAEAAAGDIDAARAAYRAGVTALAGVNAAREAAQLWFEIGSLLDAVGDEREARDAYRRAAAASGLVSPAAIRLSLR